MADLLRLTNDLRTSPWTPSKPIRGSQAYQETRQDRSRAAAITRAASLQTYMTVRFLVDRPLIPAAYQAYAYFRWVDDRLDQGDPEPRDRITFLNRQKTLMEGCLKGHWPQGPSPEEQMLVDLICGDQQASRGLQVYIRHMMAVMEMDTYRRGRLISGEELDRYTYLLASAVTEALHHFIGHNAPPPPGENRYSAATGAHITHMLRDTFDDLQAGYFNIPGEVLEANGLSPWAVGSPAYRQWVRERVNLARRSFTAGKRYLSQVENLRTRLAGCSYIARFEGVLDAIERESYLLRANYDDCKGTQTWMRGLRLSLSLTLPAWGRFSSPKAHGAI